MNIPKFFIKNWQFTVCIFLLLSYWGYQSFRLMPKSEDPLFPLANFIIIPVYPGASPSDMEEMVVNPIESALGALTEVDFIRTQINDGVANVQIRFQQSADENQKYDEVQREISKLMPTLPSGVTSVEVIQGSTSNVNILQYAITSDELSYKEMEKVAETLKTAIEKVKGVNEVAIHALPQQQVNVNIDLVRMAALGVTLKSVTDAIQSTSGKIPSGYIDVSTNRYNVTTSTEYETIDAISNTIVKSENGNLVFLKQIADVKEGYELKKYYARQNGRTSAFVTVSQQDNTDIFRITEQIEAEISPYLHNTPGVIIEKVFDQSKSVAHRLSGLYRDFAIAIVLVLFTLLPLGLRASYVVMFAIPTCIFIGLTLLDLTGYSLNQFSIVGLVIALGLLVDDSIIVVENIVARLRKGESKIDAAVNGTNQLLPAIITVTICIILSFLPLVTMEGSTGAFIRSLPLAVIYTMIGSIFVSVSLTPLASSTILKDKIGDNMFYRAVMKLNEGPFLKMLHLCLKFPKTTLLVAAALVAASLLLFKQVGVAFFPTAEKPLFLVNVTMPLESNMAAVDSTARWVEREIQKHPAITRYSTNIGKGTPQVYYNLPQQSQQSNTAQILCQLERYDKDTWPLLLDSLRRSFDTYPGAKVQVKEFVQGPPVQNPIEIRIAGNNTDTLRGLAAQVKTMMDHTEGTTYVENPLEETKADLHLKIKEEKALALGIPLSEVSKTLRMAFTGLPTGDYTDSDGNSYDIVVTVDEKQKDTFLFLSTIYVASLRGKLIPLSEIARWNFETSASGIQHYNKHRTVIITASVLPGYLTNNVTNDVLKKMEKIKLPAGYKIQAGGEMEKRKESFGGLTTALIIAVLAIIVVLVLAFNGIKGTIIVASAIPLGVVGSVIALWLTGYTFSFTAFIGVVTLIGLEVKNTIIIVDFTNQMRREGHDIDKAIELAREERFTPIFLTTLTAVCALIPLVLERSDFFSPLALVLIGGLLSSLFITRFVEPVLYKMLMK